MEYLTSVRSVSIGGAAMMGDPAPGANRVTFSASSILEWKVTVLQPRSARRQNKQHVLSGRRALCWPAGALGVKEALLAARVLVDGLVPVGETAQEEERS